MMHLVLTLGAALAAAGTDDHDALERGLDVLARLDVVTVTVDVENEPLARVIDELGASSPVPLAADWRALDALVVTPRDPVTLHVDRVPLSTALAGLALVLGDDFERPVIEVHRGQVLLTTLDATARMQMTDVYDVRDLLADGAARARLRAEAPPIAFADDEPADAGEAKPPEGPAGFEALPEVVAPEGVPPPPPVRRERTPGEELMELIAEHLDPDGWVIYGGDRATFTDRDGVLLVTAAPSLHRRFRDVLRRLRRAHPRGVTVEAAIVDVPREEYERLARRYDRASRALGQGLLGLPGATVLWRTSGGATLDRPLEVESGDRAAQIALDLAPRLDRKTGLLTIELAAITKHGEDRRSVSTTLTLPLRGAGAVVELPAATPSATVRALVLLPDRR